MIQKIKQLQEGFLLIHDLHEPQTVLCLIDFYRNLSRDRATRNKIGQVALMRHVTHR